MKTAAEYVEDARREAICISTRDGVNYEIPLLRLCVEAIEAAVAEERGTWIERFHEGDKAWAMAVNGARQAGRTDGIAEERARCVAAVQAEEELDGMPTEEQFLGMRRAGFVETCRAIVRATKKNIIRAIERGD